MAVRMSMLLAACLIQVLQALPLYSDAANSSYALVLCAGLDNAISELRGRELSEHQIGALWLEQDCVGIDVCKQQSTNRDPVFSQLMPAMAGVWLNVNSTALRLAGATKRSADAEAGLLQTTWARWSGPGYRRACESRRAPWTTICCEGLVGSRAQQV